MHFRKWYINGLIVYSLYLNSLIVLLFHPLVVVVDDSCHLGLLQHDFRHPDRVAPLVQVRLRLCDRPPGQSSTISWEPIQKICSDGFNFFLWTERMALAKRFLFNDIFLPRGHQTGRNYSFNLIQFFFFFFKLPSKSFVYKFEFFWRGKSFM